MMRAFMAVIGLYLLVALAFPLYAMLSKSFETYAFELRTADRVPGHPDGEGEGWGETLNAIRPGRGAFEGVLPEV